MLPGKHYYMYKVLVPGGRGGGGDKCYADVIITCIYGFGLTSNYKVKLF